LIPAFNRAGLSLHYGTPEFKGIVGTEALDEFFKIHYDDSRRFFLPSEYPRGSLTTAKEVARRIENFIRKESRK